MAYSEDDLVTLVTPDETLFNFKNLLVARFHTLRDYFIENPSAHQIILDLPTEGLRHLFHYFDQNILPEKVEDWTYFLLVADFLAIIEHRVVQVILSRAREVFYDVYQEVTGEDIIYYTGPITNPNLTLYQAYKEFASLL